MDRRTFLGSLAGGLLALPLVAQAQPAGKVPRIGFLFSGASGPAREVDTFRQGLRDLGYIEGQNIAIEYRFAGGQVERLPELAAELVRLKLDVIVAPYTPPALAAKRATSTIPIVFAVVADAVGAGLIANFARPGRNITGLTSSSAELGEGLLPESEGLVVVPRVQALDHHEGDDPREPVLVAERPGEHLRLVEVVPHARQIAERVERVPEVDVTE
jgi:putative ABC transport system substrate-binding protein